MIEPDTGLVTAAAVTKSAGEGATDAEAGAVLLGQDPTITTNVQVSADSAYGTGTTQEPGRGRTHLAGQAQARPVRWYAVLAY